MKTTGGFEDHEPEEREEPPQNPGDITGTSAVSQ